MISSALAAFAVAMLPLAAAQSAPKPEPKKVDPGVLTPTSLGEILTDLAYEPKPVGPKNSGTYEISTTQNGWTVPVAVGVTASGKYVALNVNFIPLAEPEKAPRAAWLKLLQLGCDHDPNAFTLDAKNRIHVRRTLDNFGMTRMELRRQIDAFDAVVRAANPYLKPANFKAATPAGK